MFLWRYFKVFYVQSLQMLCRWSNNMYMIENCDFFKSFQHYNGISQSWMHIYVTLRKYISRKTHYTSILMCHHQCEIQFCSDYHPSIVKWVLHLISSILMVEPESNLNRNWYLVPSKKKPDHVDNKMIHFNNDWIANPNEHFLIKIRSFGHNVARLNIRWIHSKFA